MVFIKNEAALNYAGTCKGICSYNLVYKVLRFFAFKKFSFCGALFKRMEFKYFQKVVPRMKLFLSL